MQKCLNEFSVSYLATTNKIFILSYIILMKVKGDTLTVIVLFGLIIGISLWISQASSVKPSSSSSSFSPYSPYRNYANYEGYQSLTREAQSVNYTDKDNQDANAINESHVSQCVQLSGWKGNGVFCAPNGGLDKIDLYSQAKGDVSCNNKSSGYHNSKGGLCLDDTMMHLLQTRGENATGGYGQIGTGQA
jgi:hypothetical protein